MTYSADILALSPLAYYRLNETTSLVDSSINARHGTWVGTLPTVVPGLVVGDANQAVSFATSGRGEVADAAWMDATSFTILATIKPSSVAGASPEILCRYNGTASGTWAANSFAFRLSTNKLQGGIFAGASTFGSATGSTVLVAGQTYDVAMRYDGTTGQIAIYLNGLVEATATRTGMNNSSMPLTIGATQTATEPFAGVIDDVAFFSGMLSNAQIEALAVVRGNYLPAARLAGEFVQAAQTLDPTAVSARLAGEVVQAAQVLDQSIVFARIAGVVVQVAVNTKRGYVTDFAGHPVMTWDGVTRRHVRIMT